MSNKVITDHGHWTDEFFKSTRGILGEDALRRVFLELGTIENILCACAELCGVVHEIANEAIVRQVLKGYHEDDTAS